MQDQTPWTGHFGFFVDHNDLGMKMDKFSKTKRTQKQTELSENSHMQTSQIVHIEWMLLSRGTANNWNQCMFYLREHVNFYTIVEHLKLLCGCSHCLTLFWIRVLMWKPETVQSAMWTETCKTWEQCRNQCFPNGFGSKTCWNISSWHSRKWQGLVAFERKRNIPVNASVDTTLPDLCIVSPAMHSSWHLVHFALQINKNCHTYLKRMRVRPLKCCKWSGDVNICRSCCNAPSNIHDAINDAPQLSNYNIVFILNTWPKDYQFEAPTNISWHARHLCQYEWKNVEISKCHNILQNYHVRFIKQFVKCAAIST